MPNPQTGALGEEAASTLYREMGYVVVARNWRCSVGELDLIVERGSTLVICEVKARSGSAFGGGFDAVTVRKQNKVRMVAEAFITNTRAAHQRIRFDVASVQMRSGVATVELFEDAF